MFGVTITVRCKPQLKATLSSLKETAASCRTRIVGEVSQKAPIVTQQVLDRLEIVSESLYASTTRFGSFIRRLSAKASTISKTSLAWVFRCLEAILSVLLAKLYTFMHNRKPWASLVGLVALGVLIRRSPILRVLFLMWRVYRLARRLARSESRT